MDPSTQEGVATSPSDNLTKTRTSTTKPTKCSSRNWRIRESNRRELKKYIFSSGCYSAEVESFFLLFCTSALIDSKWTVGGFPCTNVARENLIKDYFSSIVQYKPKRTLTNNPLKLEFVDLDWSTDRLSEECPISIILVTSSNRAGLESLEQIKPPPHLLIMTLHQNNYHQNSKNTHPAVYKIDDDSSTLKSLCMNSLNHKKGRNKFLQDTMK